MRKGLPLEALGDLLELPLLAVLATHYDDGQTLLSPVWHEWRDDAFQLVIVAGDVKSRHLARDPRASVVVAEQTPPFRSVEVRGRVELSRPADVQQTVERLATRYYGPELGAERARGFADYDIELVRLAPGVLRTWDFVDEFGAGAA